MVFVPAVPPSAGFDPAGRGCSINREPPHFLDLITTLGPHLGDSILPPSRPLWSLCFSFTELDFFFLGRQCQLIDIGRMKILCGYIRISQLMLVDGLFTPGTLSLTSYLHLSLCDFRHCTCLPCKALLELPWLLSLHLHYCPPIHLASWCFLVLDTTQTTTGRRTCLGLTKFFDPLPPEPPALFLTQFFFNPLPLTSVHCRSNYRELEHREFLADVIALLAIRREEEDHDTKLISLIMDETCEDWTYEKGDYLGYMIEARLKRRRFVLPLSIPSDLPH